MFITVEYLSAAEFRLQEIVDACAVNSVAGADPLDGAPAGAASSLELAFNGEQRREFVICWASAIRDLEHQVLIWRRLNSFAF